MIKQQLTYFQAQQYFQKLVSSRGGEPPAVTELLLGITGWTPIELLRQQRELLPLSQQQQLEGMIQRYLTGWPVQYLLGHAAFFGHDFLVDPTVLIPRPETEELVEWVLADFSQQTTLKVADIGTGSGAIGISLKLERPNWQLLLTDLSPAALQTAQKNADRLQAKVTAVSGDLLAPLTGKYDVIVSNPPYIAADERPLMDRSVLEHEPAVALFAAENGLQIYHRLAEQLADKLTATGSMYLEIGFRQAAVVKKIFQSRFPMAQVSSKKDIAGKDRMVRVRFTGR